MDFKLQTKVIFEIIQLQMVLKFKYDGVGNRRRAAGLTV